MVAASTLGTKRLDQGRGYNRLLETRPYQTKALGTGITYMPGQHGAAPEGDDRSLSERLARRSNLARWVRCGWGRCSRRGSRRWTRSCPVNAAPRRDQAAGRPAAPGSVHDRDDVLLDEPLQRRDAGRGAAEARRLLWPVRAPATSPSASPRLTRGSRSQTWVDSLYGAGAGDAAGGRAAAVPRARRQRRLLLLGHLPGLKMMDGAGQPDQPRPSHAPHPAVRSHVRRRIRARAEHHRSRCVRGVCTVPCSSVSSCFLKSSRIPYATHNGTRRPAHTPPPRPPARPLARARAALAPRRLYSPPPPPLAPRRRPSAPRPRHLLT